jgi:hypothetical protein
LQLIWESQRVSHPEDWYYRAAALPLIANDPEVIAARAAAEAAQAEVVEGIRAAQDVHGFFQTMKAGPSLSRLANEASVAERKLREAIDQALARKVEERDQVI